MAVTKRKRTPKTSKGEHGAKRHPLTPLQKILAGKGRFAALKPVSCEKPWLGTTRVDPPFDATQAKENRKLYPHLFDNRD